MKLGIITPVVSAQLGGRSGVVARETL